MTLKAHSHWKVKKRLPVGVGTVTAVTVTQTHGWECEGEPTSRANWKALRASAFKLQLSLPDNGTMPA
jgi:hypothetical protein